KVLYVWFDAPIGYISSTILWAREKLKDPDGWRPYWIRPAGEEAETRLIHFLGKDNIPFHAIIFPSMLGWQETDAAGLEAVERALGGVIGPGLNEAYVLPENVPANEFYNLEGRKFSTSDGWYVDTDAFVAEFDTDVARYAFCRTLPETSDSDFTWKEFQARTNELADAFGNFAARVLKFIARYFDNRVPTGGSGPELDRAAVAQKVSEIASEIEGYRFRSAAVKLVEIAKIGNKYFDEQEPWKTRKSDLPRCAATLRECVRLLPVMAGAAAPFVPKAASRLWAMLALDADLSWPDRTDAGKLLPEGHLLGEADVLVKKISDDVVRSEVEKLEQRAKNCKAP
ncbi:MAG: class I tRNA ligase family protein, partial [Planctomycetota bacterium]